MADAEYLEPWHFKEWGAPFIPKDIVGYALRGDDGKLICLGGIWFIEGNAWATFDSRGTPPPRVHGLGAKLLQTVKNIGVDVVWAELDESKREARKWLERFGFERHSINESGIEVWRLDLQNWSLRAQIRYGRSVRKSLFEKTSIRGR
jgi:hypothetical protein